MSSHSVDTDPTMVVEDETPEPAPNAEVVVKGRNVEVPDHFRSTSQRNCHAWNDLTAPSTYSTSNSTMSATGANARTVNT